MSWREVVGSELTKIVDASSISAAIILTVILSAASINRTCTIGSLFIALPLLFVSRNFVWSKLSGSNFYISWAACSFALLVWVFEVEVVPYLEILVYENSILVLLAGLSLLCAILVRREDVTSLSSRNQSHPLASSHFYIVWLKSGLNSRNRHYFFLGCVLAICALLYGAQLMTTTICHPVLFNDLILLPDDCTDVYHDG